MPQQILKPRRWLLGLNVMSFDAPIVALVWQDFFAVNFGLKLAPAHRALLALCAWLAYSADRWLDGLKIPDGRTVTARHAFAQRNRTRLAIPWLAVFAIAGVIAGRWLTMDLFLRGIALVTIVVIYFAINQWRRTNHWLRGVKEFFIAVIFATASAGWILPRHWLSSSMMLWAVTGWAMLCFLNCFAIAGWELNQDRVQQQESLATRWPFLTRHFLWLASLLIGYALAPIMMQQENFPWPIAVALAASAAILGLLNLGSVPGKVRSELLPIFADLALLTPLGFRFFRNW